MSILNAIRTIELDGNILYLAQDVGKVLGKRNVHNAIIDRDQKVLCDFATAGGNQKTTFFTRDGLKQLLLSTRKPNVKLLAKEFGIDIMDQKFLPIEASTLHALKEAFIGHVMLPEFCIHEFRIDLYFPEFKIAVECDEMHHAYQQKEDLARETMIKSYLGCTFIRYRPNDADFSIFKVIARIHSAILQALQGNARHEP